MGPPRRLCNTGRKTRTHVIVRFFIVRFNRERFRDAILTSLLVFYRFYSPSAAIVSRNAFDPTDPFIGRIKLTAVSPPRTVDSLKRCLSQCENLNDPANQRTDLYLTAWSDSPIQNGNLPIVGVDMGSSIHSAVALVLRHDLADSEKASVGGIHVPDNFRISPGILEGRRRNRKSCQPHHAQ